MLGPYSNNNHIMFIIAPSVTLTNKMPFFFIFTKISYCTESLPPPSPVPLSLPLPCCCRLITSDAADGDAAGNFQRSKVAHHGTRVELGVHRMYGEAALMVRCQCHYQSSLHAPPLNGVQNPMILLARSERGHHALDGQWCLGQLACYSVGQIAHAYNSDGRLYHVHRNKLQNILTPKWQPHTRLSDDFLLSL